MLKTVINKLLMVIYFICGALILEAVTFSMLGLGAWPEYGLLNFAVILFLAILVFIIPNYTAQYVVYTIILSIQTIFIYVNYSLYSIYGDLFSFDMIRLVGEAGAAVTTSFIYFSVILQLVAVFMAIVIVGHFLLKICKKDVVRMKQHFSFFSVITLIVFECFACGYYFNVRENITNLSKVNDSSYIYSDTFLLNTSILKFGSYQKFGTYGYFTNLMFNGINRYNEAIKNATVDYFDSGNMYNGEFIDSEGNPVSNNVFAKDENNNVIVIMMESLEWFCFGDGNYDETYNNLSYELTPNVYSLIYGEEALNGSGNTNINNDSLIATSFFAKSKTNISEAHGILGHYPVGDIMTSFAGSGYDKSSNAFGYTLPNVLKQNGYTTAYVHSNEIGFYDRDKTHNNLGFDTVVGKDGIKVNGELVYTGDDLKWNHWAPEAELVTNAIDYIIPETYNEKPFYTFYLNVSSHGPYEYDENDGDCLRFLDYVIYGKENCDEINGRYVVKAGRDNASHHSNWWKNVLNNYGFTDPSLCEELLYYQCGAVGLDEAIGVIIEELKTRGIYDKTTMLLYSDHYSYYDKLANRVKDFPLNDFSSVELNTIPMIISSPGVKKVNESRADKYLKTDRFCSAYDIIPTLLDLLGVSFNENLYVGHSLFSPRDYVYELNGINKDMVAYYSNTGGIFSKDVYTYNLKDFERENIGVTDEIIDMFKAEITNVLTKINYLSLLDNYQLYKYISKV